MNKFKFTNKAYIYLLPVIIITFIFTIYPLINTIIMSFQDVNGNASLSSYEYVLTNDKFLKALSNTVIYALVTTPISIILALLISYLLSLKIKFTNLFQTIYFLPYVTSTIAIGLVFKFMFHSDYGLFNAMLEAFGIDPVQWLNNPDISLIPLIIFGIWKSLAFNILLLFTAMAGINSDLERAAQVDGSKSFNTFLKIKLPQIAPVVIYLVIIGFIHSLKVYEEVVSLYGNETAGPNNAAMTVVYYIKQNLTIDPQVASVAAVILLLVTLALTLINRKISGRFNGDN